MTVLIYFLKLIACSIVLYSYYWFFLRNRRFHHYNRFFLLAIVTTSLILPLIRIPVFFESGNLATQEVFRNMDVISTDRWENEALGEENQYFNYPTRENAFLIAYGAILIFLILRLLRSVFYIRHLSRKYQYQLLGNIKLYDTDEPGTPFSFFKKIFWNRNIAIADSSGEKILKHELFHVHQLHSFDIIFTELIAAIFWINPVFHLIKKECKAIHEFLADQHAISDEEKLEYAEILLLHAMHAKKSTISNYFFQNHIKRRITMITKNKSPRYGYLARIMVLPLAAFLFISFCVKTQNQYGKLAISEQLHGAHAQPLKVMIDAGHGGMDAGAQSIDGKHLEKDLTLAISNQIKRLAGEYNIEVVMTRETDIYPPIKSRTIMAQDLKAEAFVSIHIAAEPETDADKSSKPERKTGFEIFVPSRNPAMLDASKNMGTHVARSLRSLYTVDEVLKQRNSQGIWVLDAAPCPTIIVECGYMTNDKDLAFITQPLNQEMIARKILSGLQAYQQSRGQQPNSTTTKAGQSTDTLLSYLQQQYMKLILYPATARKAGIEKTTYVTFQVEGNQLMAREFSESRSTPEGRPSRGITVVGYNLSENHKQTKPDQQAAEFIAEIVRASTKIAIPEDLAAGASEPFEFRFDFVLKNN